MVETSGVWLKAGMKSAHLNRCHTKRTSPEMAGWCPGDQAYEDKQGAGNETG